LESGRYPERRKILAKGFDVPNSRKEDKNSQFAYNKIGNRRSLIEVPLK
jgi:hypothetical protein